MERLFSRFLKDWLSSLDRKPLILRGARQVGKTWLVRDFAKRTGRDLVEINFERNPELRKRFASNDPRMILDSLAFGINREIRPEQSILFLDEIQAAGEILAKLRWFAEELPELPVIAAGSLLEFTLADHSFSFPVGRVAFRNVEPLGFEEYLMAHGQARLVNALKAWRPGGTLPEAAHEEALKWFHRFGMVGGMPQVVAADVAGAGPAKCREMQQDLIMAFRADFAKYSGRLPGETLDAVLRAVAGSIGRKFMYSKVDDGVKAYQAKRALDLLASARVCHLVRYSAGNGLPLGSETKDTFRKAVLVDVGLLHGLLGTPAIGDFPSRTDLSSELRGRIAEQTAAQHLRLRNGDGTGDPDLHYWQREGGRPGEIDYLFAWRSGIVPIELKSGAAGKMKSLHQFMHDKDLRLAIRSDANPPGEQTVAVSTTQGDSVTYRLLNVPLYLLWNLQEILPESW